MSLNNYVSEHSRSNNDSHSDMRLEEHIRGEALSLGFKLDAFSRIHYRGMCAAQCTSETVNNGSTTPTSVAVGSASKNFSTSVVAGGPGADSPFCSSRITETESNCSSSSDRGKNNCEDKFFDQVRIISHEAIVSTHGRAKREISEVFKMIKVREVDHSCIFKIIYT